MANPAPWGGASPCRQVLSESETVSLGSPSPQRADIDAHMIGLRIGLNRPMVNNWTRPGKPYYQQDLDFMADALYDRTEGAMTLRNVQMTNGWRYDVDWHSEPVSGAETFVSEAVMKGHAHPLDGLSVPREVGEHDYLMHL